MHDRRFIDLELPERGVLLSLYLACDMHGRIEADDKVLSFRLFYMDADQLNAVVRRLAESRFLHIYTRDGGLYIQIDKWDVDMTPSMRRKRGASSCPYPPDEIANLAGCVNVHANSSREPARQRAAPQRTARKKKEKKEKKEAPPASLISIVSDAPAADQSLTVADRKRELKDELTRLAGGDGE